MFFAIEQMFDRVGERFIAFEANTPEQAIERAQWYGINLQERNPRGRAKWEWDYTHEDGTPRGFERPQISYDPLETFASNGGWAILYLNNNLASSFAIE